MKFLTQVILPVFLFYGAIAFIQASFNFTTWDIGARFSAVIGYSGYLFGRTVFSYLEHGKFLFWK